MHCVAFMQNLPHLIFSVAWKTFSHKAVLPYLDEMTQKRLQHHEMPLLYKQSLLAIWQEGIWLALPSNEYVIPWFRLRDGR